MDANPTLKVSTRKSTAARSERPHWTPRRAGRLLVAEAMVIEREVADELCDAAIGQSGAGELFELSVPVGCYDPALQIRALGSYA